MTEKPFYIKWLKSLFRNIISIIRYGLKCLITSYRLLNLNGLCKGSCRKQVISQGLTFPGAIDLTNPTSIFHQEIWMMMLINNDDYDDDDDDYDNDNDDEDDDYYRLKPVS